MPTLEFVMEKIRETYRTKITPAQPTKLFTAAKDPKRPLPEHYMYLVAISEACGGGADYLVLNNIVQFTSEDLCTVLMAKKGYTLTERSGCRVLAAKNGGRVIFDVDMKGTDKANKFESFLVFFEKRCNCRIHILRTDSGGEYENVDLFCKGTRVTRQRSEAWNQRSNGKAERMHRTIMDMARCMIFASGLPLKFWDGAVEYAAPILNRSQMNANPGRVSPMKLLTKETPKLGKLVTGVILGTGEETKGYRMYLPKANVGKTTQHVRNIETLDKEQNENVQKLYLQATEVKSEEESTGDAAAAASDFKKSKRKGKTKKNVWTRDRHVTRSAAREDAAEVVKQEEQVRDVVNTVTEQDPKNYGESMRSNHKDELRALNENGV
ncbi:hypothetical protein PHMEG_00029793 [Phytophthora megakarya]|uniref:Integrase catalytic domain-containing protein n=1 Tax=Phytophthora megakarya TaxID=4795 RepID=A0A225V2R3_9STRA|nr:hypothetical protein PHMEG_00029793 [Phytophthora megakarya]